MLPHNILRRHEIVAAPLALEVLFLASTPESSPDPLVCLLRNARKNEGAALPKTIRPARRTSAVRKTRPAHPAVKSAKKVRRAAVAEAFEEVLFDDEFEAVAPPADDEFGEPIDDDSEIEHAGAEHTGEDDQIDDPVRIYLMQMGEIPLLNKHEEVSVARRIERSRRQFRRCMLANDFVLQAAIVLLESIRDNRVRLDRTIEVSVTNLREKRRLLKVLGPNLQTLNHLMLQNQRDFVLAIDRREPRKSRRGAWRRLLTRRVKAVRLVEEMGLRIQRLQPLLEKLKLVSADGRDSPTIGRALPR